MKKDKIIYWVVVIASLMYVLFMLFSCSPYKRLQERKPKNEKEKSLLAAACVEQFQSKTDTITEYITDTIEADNTSERVELNKIIDSLIIEKSKIEHDTALIKELEDRLKEALEENCPPPKVITNTKVVTVTKPDAAKEYLLSQHILKLQADSTILTNERDAAIKERNNIQDKQESSVSYNLGMAFKALWHQWWWYLILGLVAVCIWQRFNPYSFIKNIITKFKI